MTRASLARRLRKAAEASPLPPEVEIGAVVETGKNGKATNAAVTYRHGEGVDVTTVEKAVFKRLQRIGAVMGQTVKSPRRIPRSALPADIDDE